MGLAGSCASVRLTAWSRRWSFFFVDRFLFFIYFHFFHMHVNKFWMRKSEQLHNVNARDTWGTPEPRRWDEVYPGPPASSQTQTCRHTDVFSHTRLTSQRFLWKYKKKRSRGEIISGVNQRGENRNKHNKPEYTRRLLINRTKKCADIFFFLFR